MGALVFIPHLLILWLAGCCCNVGSRTSRFGKECLVLLVADVAELADALDSKSSIRKGMCGFDPPPSVPLNRSFCRLPIFSFDPAAAADTPGFRRVTGGWGGVGGGGGLGAREEAGGTDERGRATCRTISVRESKKNQAEGNSCIYFRAGQSHRFTPPLTNFRLLINSSKSALSFSLLVSIKLWVPPG